MRYRGTCRSAWLLETTLVSCFLSSSAWARTGSRNGAYSDNETDLPGRPDRSDDNDGVVATPERDTSVQALPTPRLKLSAVGFSIDNLNGSPVPLRGAHLDVYALSERWIRGGFILEGGTGTASAVGSTFSVTYGLLGLSAGVQYPAPITPFIEGHLSGGVLSGRQDGPITVAGTTVTGASGTTWLYGRGLDVGAEFYVAGRVYVSVAVGWMRATWGAPDFSPRLQNPQAEIRLFDITSDSFLWKLGFGI